MEPGPQSTKFRYKDFKQLLMEWKEQGYRPLPERLIKEVQREAARGGHDEPFASRIREWTEWATRNRKNLLDESETPAAWVRNELPKYSNEYLAVDELTRRMSLRERAFVQAFCDMLSEETKRVYAARSVEACIVQQRLKNKDDIEVYCNELIKDYNLQSKPSDIMDICYAEDPGRFHILEEKGMAF